MLLLNMFMERQQEYIQMLTDTEMSENTIKQYTTALKKFIAFALITDHCDEICKDCFIDYKEYLVKTYKPRTSNLYINALNKYLKYLKHDDLCIKTLKIQCGNSLENCFSIGEYEKALNTAKRMKNAVYYVMRALASTGVRVSELEYFTVDAIKTGGCTISNKGKIRDIIIPQRVCTELMKYCLSKNITDGLVFHARNTDKCINEVTVLRWLKATALKAGIDQRKAFPHNLRHLFAITYMAKYNDLVGLADILGHTNIETTRIYTRTSIEEKRIKLENLNL